MRKARIIFFALTLIRQSFGQYVSPGIRLGYDFKSHVTLGLKVSVGFVLDGTVVNLTLGKKQALSASENYAEHGYLDIQAGSFSKEKQQFFYGGGIGLVFFKKENKRIVRPRLTGFAGMLLFATVDLFADDKWNLQTDSGLQLVLPIPLYGVDIGSPGG